ncbi:phage head completion protein [Stenotrophomonas pictorum]|uniref:phage head completion protein n=1 Tax=Stenotrophomonas pictorum TaxID=86184 RepID=UPI0006D2C467|nr:head-tail adaptor protein [Stenotrophomonas pictorum]
MKSGRLRHRIAIQERQLVVAPNGDREWSWVEVHADVPASFTGGPGREFLAAESIRAETVGRFELRYLRHHR